MPVVPRKGPHPFAKPLVVFGVKRPRSSVIANAPCPTDTSALDPEPSNTSPDPTETTQSPSWLDGPYGPAAEARMDAREARIRAGEISLRSIEKLIEAKKENPEADKPS
jgi:hypothetical protein